MDKKSEDKARAKARERSKTLKYMSVGLNMAYTLCTPIVLMLLLYFFVVEKYFGRHPLILIFLIVLGIVSGYYSFFKILKDIVFILT